MKKTGKTIAAFLIAGCASGGAQTSNELQALRQQLDVLSAKVAQLESAPGKEHSQDSAQKKLPDWVYNTKFKGDLMYIYQHISSESPDTAEQSRHRIRLRAGAFGNVSDSVDYGIRLATGGANAVNANQDIDGATKKEIRLDQYYVDLHPEQLCGTHLFAGKMPQPWLDRTGLIWDSDLNPEGFAATFSTASTNRPNLLANAGHFVIRESGGNDLRLWSAQLAGEAEIPGSTVRLGMSSFYYQNEEKHGAASGLTADSNTPGTGFNLIEGFGSVGFSTALPVVLNGQYVINTEAATHQNAAWLFGITAGDAKKKGDWEAGYNYRITEADAVPDGFNEGTFGGGRTGTKGHCILLKYHVAKNVIAQMAGSLATDDKDRYINIVQFCATFKF